MYMEKENTNENQTNDSTLADVIKEKAKNKVESLGAGKKVRKVWNKFLFQIVIFVIGFVLGISIFIIKPRERKDNDTINPDKTIILPEDYELTVENVKEVLAPASDLITTKYFYTDVGVDENSKMIGKLKLPFTTDKVVFIYSGIIYIGIDIEEVAYEIDNENKQITIILPECSIKANTVDESSIECPYMEDSVFNSTTMDYYMNLIGELKEQKAEEVMNNTEFMKQARINTEQTLREFLTLANSTKEYEIIFR